MLGCFDRVIFRGYLPLQDGYSMAQFLNQNAIRFRYLKSFLLEQAARAMAERDGIEQGLVCVFSVLLLTGDHTRKITRIYGTSFADEQAQEKPLTDLVTPEPQQNPRTQACS